MAKARIRAGLAAGCLLLWGTASVWAAPSVAQMLSFRPKQEGIVFTTPTAQEQEGCKVELDKEKNGRGSGWVLKDKNDKVLRRYYDTNGDNKIDVWSYYLNGAEVYREVDSNFNDKADQYRWFNGAGTRWGVDVNEDGKIDTWKQISPEEVSQEILQAVVKRDLARLQALMLTEAELKSLDLPAAETNRLRDLTRKAPAKFQETCAKAGNLSDKMVRWVHLENAAPQCLPAGSAGLMHDLVKYQQGSITYIVDGMKEPAGLLTGEIIQVGGAWRIVDAPVPDLGQGVIDGGDTLPNGSAALTKESQADLDELRKVDESAPDNLKATPADLARYNVRRADVLERIAGKVRADDREQWLRQMADCLSAAVQNVPAEKDPLARLAQLRERVVRDYAGSGLAAHVSFCELTADYAIKLGGSPDITKVQKEYMERLSKFVQDYSKSEDTPDALMQLGMMNELLNDEGPAKKWYELMVKDFAGNPQIGKAHGAMRRLDLDGKELELTGTTLAGTSFDIKTSKAKVLLVYYWASWNQQCAGDFGKIKTLLGTYGSKGLEVVSISLDDNAAAAREFTQANAAAGTHLYEQGGMGSKLGEQYGIMVLPTMFVIKEGKVVSHNAQIATLEDDLKKLLP